LGLESERLSVSEENIARCCLSSPDEFMTVAEVAAILKPNRQTVRNWIDSGFLPAIHVGIKGSHFDRLLEQSYTGGTSALARTTASIWEERFLRPNVGVGPNDESEGKTKCVISLP
jgi:excisionase family DNA binding protein